MKNTTVINYKILPQAVRLAVAKEAVARVKAKENASEVAKSYGTTLALVLSWVKRDAEGTLGKRLHADKVTGRVDHRNLPDAVRLVTRKTAKEMRKNGESIANTARLLGTTELSIRRWEDGDEAGFETYGKRGRKAHTVEVETSTEVTTEVATEVQG